MRARYTIKSRCYPPNKLYFTKFIAKNSRLSLKDSIKIIDTILELRVPLCVDFIIEEWDDTNNINKAFEMISEFASHNCEVISIEIAEISWRKIF